MVIKNLCKTTGFFFDTILQWERLATTSPIISSNPPPASQSQHEEDPLQTFYTTLCTGNMPDSPDESYTTFLRIWHTQTKGVRRLAKLDDHFGRRRGVIRRLLRSWYHPLMGLLGIQYNSFEGEALILRDMAVCFSRRLARTEKGRLALVPGFARRGDQVALCRGGKAPLIVREHGEGEWEVVGCGYVHGIMEGEAWREERCEIMGII
jgi:hypothetical protein